MKVQLLTKTGGRVVNVDLPPFDTQPDVIIWGERFFRHDRGRSYVEAFTWVVPPDYGPATGEVDG